MSPGTEEEELVGSSSTHVQEVGKAAEEDLRPIIGGRSFAWIYENSVEP